MLVIWVSLAYLGLDVGLAFLMGLSAAMIAATAALYRDARNDARYWIAIVGYSIVHVLVLSVTGSKWIPKPAAAMSPVFILDFVVMAYLLPKVTRIEFVDD